MFDDEDLDEDLEADDARELRLALIGRFTQSLVRIPWFAHTGAAFDPALRRDARDFLDALGFPEVAVTRISGWADAAAAAESLDWDSPGWEVEESLRADLTQRAQDVLGADALEVALAHVASAVTPLLEEALRSTAVLWGIEDEALLMAALGAGAQAAHLGALVLGAGETIHPFALKFRLFERGRWPIGVAGTSFNIL